VTLRVEWTCDRCRGVEYVDSEVVIVEEWGPSAVRKEPSGNSPDGWRSYASDTAVEDVCPGCLTDEERVDIVLTEIESDAMF
jgi:hypothetical protein